MANRWTREYFTSSAHLTRLQRQLVEEEGCARHGSSHFGKVRTLRARSARPNTLQTEVCRRGISLAPWLIREYGRGSRTVRGP